jgi:hypothetical protein
MLTDCEFSTKGGTRIDLEGDGPIVELLRKYKKHLTYEAVISKPPGNTLAYITGTNKVASIQRSKEGGYLILLPAINFEAEQAGDLDLATHGTFFLMAMDNSLHQQQRGTTGVLDRVHWPRCQRPTNA